MRRKGKAIKTIIIVVLLMLFIPIPSRLKDGGSLELKAVVYKITKYNRLSDVDGEKETGWKLEIFGKEVYEKLNNENHENDVSAKDIDKPNGYYVIDIDNKKVLIDVKNKKYNELHTFSADDIVYFGEYENKHYFGSGMQLKYYSISDKKEHLWLEVDEEGSCRNEVGPSFCSKLYTVTKGVVIEDVLYYHIATDAIGNENNYLFKINLNATTINETDSVIEHIVLSWQLNNDYTKILGRLLNSDLTEADFEYDIATKSIIIK